METGEIRQIAGYFAEIEERLDLWECLGPITLGDLNRLHETIPRLVRAAYKSDDRQLRPILTTLEYKARTCKNCIERRLAVRN
ncbi:MAG: hypothetical protein ACYS74_03070 [Planctomycetota bacterium]|jgi:hypothetical protein